MKDIRKLWKAVGIEPEAVYFDKDELGFPVIRSDFTMIRRVTPAIIESEKETLAEAVRLYKNGIMVLCEEADLILRHLDTYYENIDFTTDQ